MNMITGNTYLADVQIKSPMGWVKVEATLTLTSETDFSGSGKGTYPIVVSYASSPSFTVSKDKSSSTTSALLDTAFRQVEYAGASG